MLLGLEIIAEDETALFAGMAMQIEVDLEASALILLNHSLLGLIDGGLPVRTWVQVESIEVVVVGIQSIVPTSHTIRVKQWNYLEAVLLQEDCCLLTLIQQEINQPVEYMTTLYFSRMYSGT